MLSMKPKNLYKYLSIIFYLITKVVHVKFVVFNTVFHFNWKVWINLPPAPTHSDHELNSVGSVEVLLQKPVIAEQILNAKINFT